MNEDAQHIIDRVENRTFSEAGIIGGYRYEVQRLVRENQLLREQAAKTNKEFARLEAIEEAANKLVDVVDKFGMRHVMETEEALDELRDALEDHSLDDVADIARNNGC